MERGKKGNRERVPISTLTSEGEGKIVGLYFSAEWCPPCRAFTPELAEWYTRLTQGHLRQKLEIVFVSSDRNEDKFDEYYDTMPWLALPYQYRDCKVSVRVYKGLFGSRFTQGMPLSPTGGPANNTKSRDLGMHTFDKPGRGCFINE